MKIRTHTFRLGTYDIEPIDGDIDGLCEVPNDPGDTSLLMMIRGGDDFRALNSALHEAMHAEGIPDKYLHDKDGYSDTERLARFLWRLGYRK